VTNVEAISSSGLPDMGASLLRLAGAMLVVITLFLAGVWLVKNWQRFGRRRVAAPKLSVLEVKSLGQRQALYVVGYEQQRLLIASSTSGLTLLSHLPAADEPPPGAAPKISFAEAFQHVLAGKS
jgi:flagellar biogenesis protein FliO